MTLPGYTGPLPDIAIGRPVVSVVGGLGHVGLPLGAMLADSGLVVHALDIDDKTATKVNAGRMPFIEEGAQEVLDRVLGNTFFAQHPGGFADAYRLSDCIVITVGTPLDEYQNPRLGAITAVAESLLPHLHGQLVILRSTVFPGTTERMARFFRDAGADVDVAFCPERIVQGQAVRELRELPQIVSGVTPRAAERATGIFAKLGVETVMTSVANAEIAKLYLNAWRYIGFAVGNAFWGIAEERGLDYAEIERVMKKGYARAAALPSPGFAAGPCLLKDTMQLAAATSNGFPLGNAARMVNEGQPELIVRKLRERGLLTPGTTVGILGMAFKADNDDTRDSLSFKLKKLLEFAGCRVLCSDEYATGDGWRTKEEIMAECSGIVVAVPHSAYRGMMVPNGKAVVDLWGIVSL